MEIDIWHFPQGMFHQESWKRLYFSFTRLSNDVEFGTLLAPEMGFPGGAAVKNPPANAAGTRDVVSVPRSGRSLGGGNGNPLQCSCLVNFMNRGAWWTSVQGIGKSWTWLSTYTTCSIMSVQTHIFESHWKQFIILCLVFQRFSIITILLFFTKLVDSIQLNACIPQFYCLALVVPTSYIFFLSCLWRWSERV